MKTYLKAFTAVAAIAVIGLSLGMPVKASYASKDNPTLAIVNGKEIKRSEVMKIIEGQHLPHGAPVEQVIPQVIDFIINDRLLDNKISTAGLDNDPEVQKRLKEAKDQIVKSIYLEREVGKLVTDEKIKAEYEKIKKEQSKIKETRARHILVKTEDEAKAIIEKLNGGADFVKLAKKESTGPTGANGGDLGYFSKEQMVPAFSAAAFEIKPGTYGRTPVKTQFGWHVIKVEDRRSKMPPKLEEVKDAIKGKLGQKALETYVKELRKTAKIERFSLDGKPLK